MSFEGCTDRCWLTQTTSSLAAQGTAVGVVLAGLVWLGASLLGLLLLWMLLLLLLGILCTLLDCALSCTGCETEAGPACGPCCPPCPDPCDPCGACCSGCGDCGCDTGDGGSGGNGGDVGNGDTSEVGAGGLLLPGTATAAALAARGRRIDLAHHPDLPQYRPDVYHVRGRRLCIGCFTTYPLFLVMASVLFLAHPPLTWASALGGGAALAALQGVSTLGLARAKILKVLVKAGLGIGLALYTYGVLLTPLGFWGRYLLLGLALGLAMASTVPRSRRMRRERAARGEACTHRRRVSDSEDADH